MSTAIEAIKNLAKEVAEAKKAVKSKGKVLFKEAAAELFVAHPNLVSFSWTQYAPYFNDGDACTFSAHTECIRLQTTDSPIAGEEYLCDECGAENREDCECDGQEFSSYDYSKTKKKDRTPRQLAGEAVLDLLGLFDDEAYEVMFDSGRVVVTAKGIEVEDYNHD